MKRCNDFLILALATCTVICIACNTIEKVSPHGFNSGYYRFKSEKNAAKVYVDVTEETIDVYHLAGMRPQKEKFLSIPDDGSSGVLPASPLTFRKQSLDIDLTTLLLKYRPSVYGLPQQLTADFNIALYAGWRYDRYRVKSKIDPLGKSNRKISSLGYDFGVFAGPGVAPVNPFNTRNRTDNEYSGMMVQTGAAGFLETGVASFGLAFGFDYLLNRDRRIWIYHNKPWIGFIVGVGL